MTTSVMVTFLISPCDVYDTSEALHATLTMPCEERAPRAARLRALVAEPDSFDWLCRQLEVIDEAGL